jgi:hypothetical protein
LYSIAKFEHNLNKAAHFATMLSAFDALPLGEVCLFYCFTVLISPCEVLIFSQSVSVLHSVLRRCVDGGWLTMVTVLIQALRVPVLDPDELCEFFTSSEVRYLS